MLSHYDASQEVCNLIHLGPSEGDIAEFLTALDKLKRAKDYFLNNNSQSVELENVTSLFNTGCESLNNHYKSLLKKHSAPIKPVDLLDLIYIEEDSSNEDCTSIKQITQNTREELSTISNWLEYNLCREYMEIYATERSNVVFRSLQMLKDHQRTGSWGNEPAVCYLRFGFVGLQSTRALFCRRIVHTDPQMLPSRTSRSPHPHAFRTCELLAERFLRSSSKFQLNSRFERKANKMLLKASQTIEQSTGISLKKAANPEQCLATDNLADKDHELDKYLVLLLGLQRLLIWERHLLGDIIPSTRHNEIFTNLAQNSIDMVVKDVELITARALRNIARKRWSSSLEIFSALKNLIVLQPDIDKACDLAQRQQMNGILQRLQQTVRLSGILKFEAIV